MKFKIKKEIVTAKEKEIEIKLESYGEDIYLVVGPCFVLGIKPDGKIESYSGCKVTGLNVDAAGHIIVGKSNE